MLGNHDPLVDSHRTSDEASVSDCRFAGDGRLGRDRNVLSQPAAMAEVNVIIYFCSTAYRCIADCTPINRCAVPDGDVIANFDTAEIR